MSLRVHALATARCLTGTASLLLALMIPAGVSAQTTCEVNRQAACTIQDATMTITLTISRVARLSASGTTLTLPAPSALAVDGAPGLPASYPVSVQSNSPWTLGLSALSTLWTGTPIASARQNKPAGDLEWNNPALNATYVPLTGSAVTVGSGPATALTALSLNLRVRYTFTTDVPGSYTLPLQLLLTAP